MTELPPPSSGTTRLYGHAPGCLRMPEPADWACVPCCPASDPEVRAERVTSECISCGTPKPEPDERAVAAGWRWATFTDGDPARKCGECQAKDVDYIDGFPPPRW